jgi:electron transfer flavoprotein beta subunit
MGAKKKPQELLTAQQLGLSPELLGEQGSKTLVLKLNPPPSRGESLKLEDDGSGADKIVEFLAEKRLL